jgi:hypothetical protein
VKYRASTIGITGTRAAMTAEGNGQSAFGICFALTLPD